VPGYISAIRRNYIDRSRASHPSGRRRSPSGPTPASRPACLKSGAVRQP